jgi:hypothetical protein
MRHSKGTACSKHGEEILSITNRINMACDQTYSFVSIKHLIYRVKVRLYNCLCPHHENM